MEDIITDPWFVCILDALVQSIPHVPGPSKGMGLVQTYAGSSMEK